MNGAKMTGAALVLALLAAALLGPELTAFAPFASSGARLESPSAAHWLGTNSLGQDVFSGLVHGARTTLLVGFAVSALSTALSGLLGLAAGYSRRADPLLNALANMLLVLPSLLLILIVASFTGGGTLQLVLTLGLLTWPGYMRIIRASVLSLKEREFVKAARLYRGGTWYIFRKHLLPFLLPLLGTKFLLSFRMAVMTEAGLSFLGIGDANRASWGKMLELAFQANETWLSDAWTWTVLPPILALLAATLGLALLGDGRSAARRGRTARASGVGGATAEAAGAGGAGGSSVGDAAAEEAGVSGGVGSAEAGVAGASGGVGGAVPSTATAGVLAFGAGSPRAAADARCSAEPLVSAAAIAADRFGASLGGRLVVQPASFELAAGSVTALIGESGSGKTTLARALYGLLPERAVTGRALVAGKMPYGGRGDRRFVRWTDAAFIFQDPRASLNPLLTIGRQFAETMRRRLSPGEKRAAAAQALREVQLDAKWLDRYPHELSGGMLGRVQIALALINLPAVLIADEPTGALDPIVSREIVELLLAKTREHGMTLLLITHDLRLAAYAADRVLEMRAGRLTELLPTELAFALEETGTTVAAASGAEADGAAAAAARGAGEEAMEHA